MGGDGLRYECCGCDADVTALVEEAFQEQLVALRLETAETADERESVIVMCPNGHWCRYYPAS